MAISQQRQITRSFITAFNSVFIARPCSNDLKVFVGRGGPWSLGRGGCLLRLFKLRNLAETRRVNENELGNKTEQYYRRTADGKLLLRQVLARHVPAEVSEGEKQGKICKVGRVSCRC